MTNIGKKLPGGLDILTIFTRNYSKKLHASEISRELKLPRKTVALKLEKFQRLNLLNYERVGKNKYFFFDLNNPVSASLLYLIESYKEVNFILNYPHLSNLFSELSLKYSLVLFGSYSKGKAKEDSDIDLVLFGKENKTIKEILGKYSYKVHVQYNSLELFRRRLNESWPLAKEIAKDHIFFGKKEEIISLLINYYKK